MFSYFSFPLAMFTNNTPGLKFKNTVIAVLNTDKYALYGSNVVAMSLEDYADAKTYFYRKPLSLL